VGAYYIGRENRLLPFDADDADFKLANRLVSEFPGVGGKSVEGTSLLEYLRRSGLSERMVSLLEAGYANTWGGSLDRISLPRTIEQDHAYENVDGPGNFRVEGGMSNIVAALAKGVNDVRLRGVLLYRSAEATIEPRTRHRESAFA